eukprot:CAMPEP_0204546114 /NCGR_PEP_ID=MMETSP0661-20131031/21780_1 /ASSEMBLY_ACC=CAM_ASM_000606 /TAXON_ID=109239 /ORGANISM="Alexandrium margalefi, Strain AMGDE01CS-322" /LENGTH=37 /DNA_ID= /DNA_START= /DNA_END= /DNA_ORIENTATION=
MELLHHANNPHQAACGRSVVDDPAEWHGYAPRVELMA